MPTEFLTAVGSEGIALFHHGEAAAQSLSTFLQGKGYRIYPTTERGQLVALAQSDSVSVALVQVASAEEALAVMEQLPEGSGSAPVIALCEGPVHTDLLEKLPKDRYPAAVLVRPAPFAQILGEVEKQLARRVSARATGEKPAILFAQLLAHMWSEHRTGRLQVTVNGVQTTIYLRDGLPVFAEQGSLGDTLGRMLVRTGRITNDDFSRAVELITERMVDNEQMRLGEALIELQVLTAQEIHDALRAQVRQKILSCFRAQQFHSDFRAGEDLLEPVGDFSSPMGQLLAEGLKTVNPARLDELLGPLDARYPTIAHDPATMAAAFALTRQEQSFLATLDGTRTLRQLRESSQLDRIHATQVLSALLLGRSLVWHEAPQRKQPIQRSRIPHEAEPAAAEAAAKRRHGSARIPGAPDPARHEDSAVMALYVRIKGRPDHGVLGVAPGASTQQIEEAYQRRTAELQAVEPDKAQGSPSVRSALEALGQHMRAARDRLVSAQANAPERDDSSGETDERKRRLLAEQSYQAAMESYRAGKNKDALAKANEAVKQHPEAAEYQLLQAWVAYRSSTGKAKQKTATRAFDCARSVFSQDGTDVLGNLVLGHILAQKGKRERAKRHLILALHHDTHKMDEIQDELKKLDQRQVIRRVKER